MASTQDATLVAAALEALKFKDITDGPPGTPPKFQVTHETIAYLRRDREFIVNGDGAVTPAE